MLVVSLLGRNWFNTALRVSPLAWARRGRRTCTIVCFVQFTNSCLRVCYHQVMLFRLYVSSLFRCKDKPFLAIAQLFLPFFYMLVPKNQGWRLSRLSFCLFSKVLALKKISLQRHLSWVKLSHACARKYYKGISTGRRHDEPDGQNGRCRHSRRDGHILPRHRVFLRFKVRNECCMG